MDSNEKPINNDSSVPSTRFADGGGEIIIDVKKKLVWLKKDSWQLTGKWLNWVQARDYGKELNKQAFGGYQDWRMPSAAEAKSLFDKTQINNDYMGKAAFLYKIFPKGFGFLCWTSDVRDKVQAVRFGFRKGGVMYDDIYRVSRGSTRYVRDIE
ncbi:MAG: DUF1566 domain-containing protein [Nitrospinales bacterium]